MRILFLDDEAWRAEAFAAANPDVVWAKTVEECLGLLEEPWDEVHLDHDLGGQTYVDTERDDCGMAVVRWLCDAHRPHLRGTRFFVHSHNANAACAMAFHLQVVGYRVEVRPFDPRTAGRGASTLRPASRVSLVRRILGWLAR